MRDKTYSEITNLILTKYDLDKINSELDLLEASFYETKDKSFESVLKNSISDGLAALISDKDSIKKIRDYVQQIKCAELTLAIDPSQQLVEKLSNWFYQNLHQKIALDIKVDPKIIGGIELSLNGKYYDGSLKGKLDKILKKYV